MKIMTAERPSLENVIFTGQRGEYHSKIIVNTNLKYLMASPKKALYCTVKVFHA